MTTTIEIPTLPAEPDRSTRWRTSSVEGEPLHYSEEMGGWTWGTCMAAISWSQLLAGHRDLFPLTKVERTVRTHEGAVTVTDSTGDELKIEIGCAGGVALSDECVALSRDNLVKLRDFLNEHITVKEA